MANPLAQSLTDTIEQELLSLFQLKDEQASMPRGPGKWSAKEELGHLIDSAANNHIRFVRAALETQLEAPGYRQNEWVQLHGYQTMAWTEIVDLWFRYNSLLARVIGNIPEAKLDTQCRVAENPAVPLSFLISDYLAHMHNHLDMLLRRKVIRPYPLPTPQAPELRS